MNAPTPHPFALRNAALAKSAERFVRPSVTLPNSSSVTGGAPESSDVSSLQFLPRNTVSAMLGVHVDTVRNWERSGKLKAYALPGRLKRYDVKDVLALLEELQFRNLPGPKTQLRKVSEGLRKALGMQGPASRHQPGQRKTDTTKADTA